MSAPAVAPTPLVICSKSRWLPAIRREHSLAALAARNGHAVTFIERPLDIRALCGREGAAEWWRGLRSLPTGDGGPAGVSVIPRATVAPGHRGGAAELSENLLLRRCLRRVPADAAIVVNVPWQWPAAAGLGARRIFDCADDWSTLMGQRNSGLARLYERIGAEADAIVLVSPELAGRFPAERTTVVPNGVSEDMLGPLCPPAEELRMVHTGTLTPRFDAPLAGELLSALPEWTLELYGQCQYPGAGQQPGEELARLLAEHPSRVRWHGVVPRESLAEVIDRSAVTLVLNRPDRSAGQDSMKLYDYAARGRPIVTTAFSESLEGDGPPHLRVAAGPAEMAAAVLQTRQEPPDWALARRRWAQERRWENRWGPWSAAVFGEAGR